MNRLFQVVFTGQLLPGVNPEQAARDFAAVFKIPEEKAWRLILDQHEHVLKREVNEANADRYREVLEEVGLLVRVEPAGTPLEGEPSGDAVADGSDAGDAAAGTDAELGFSSPAAESSLRVEPDNPYAPPGADLTPPRGDGDGPMTGPHAVPAGHGWSWIKDAYALFRSKPGTWMLAILLMYGISFVVGLVPVLGSLVGFVLGPIFIGGLMIGARVLDQDGRARAGMVFDAFSSHGTQLALVGLLYLLGFILVVFAAGLVAMGAGVLSSAGLEALSSNDPEVLASAMAPTALLLLMLIAMALIIPLVMAYWFAPALVVLEDMGAVDAMKTSFQGCWRNVVPFLVYGLALMGVIMLFAILMTVVVGGAAAALGSAGSVIGVLAAIAMVPLMLAYAVVIVVSQYTGYRDIFRQPGNGGTLM
jgi:uncharacterized membrane protein